MHRKRPDRTGQALQLCGGGRPAADRPAQGGVRQKRPEPGKHFARAQKRMPGRETRLPAVGELCAKGEKILPPPPPPERRAMPPARWPTRTFQAGLLAGLPPMPLAEWRGEGREEEKAAAGISSSSPSPPSAEPHAAPAARAAPGRSLQLGRAVQYCTPAPRAVPGAQLCTLAGSPRVRSRAHVRTHR